MGFRNAFRFSVDTDGTVYIADYGPDAGSREPEPRPRRPGRVERDQAARQLWLAVLRRRQRRLQRLRLRHQHVRARSSTARRRSTTRPTTRASATCRRRSRPTSSTATASRRPGRSSARARPRRWPAPSTTTTRARPSTTKWPQYFDGKPLFYEWGRNFIHEWPLAADGKVLTMNPRAQQHGRSSRRWTCSSAPTARCTCSSGAAASAATTRTRACTGSTTPPTAARRRRAPRARRTPAALRSRCSSPARARSTATATRSRYRWDFGDGTTSTEANPKHTYTAIGNYEARLTVTEATASAKTGTATVPIIVGNTRPTVTISAPPDGGFFEWGDDLPWQVSVTDPDETVDCAKVIVQPALGHDEHAHPELATNACSGTARTFLDEGHAEANAFWVIDARYTDSGGQGGSQPLTGERDERLPPEALPGALLRRQPGRGGRVQRRGRERPVRRRRSRTTTGSSTRA